jgi:hypothetical protein
MAYLEPAFKYDVFVSHSHGNPTRAGVPPLKQWTDSLIDDLKAEIQSVDTEFDDLHFWLDKQIDPTAALTQELRDSVKASGILMIIMSPRYLASSWCKDELDWFRQQVRDRASDEGRAFVIRALATNETDWPDFLRDERGNSLIGFRFHDPSDSMPYGWGGVRDKDYVRQLWTLQTALTKRLRELRGRYEMRVKEAQPVTLMAAPAGGRKRVYLHARNSDAPAREDVQRQLSGLGITPLNAIVDQGDALAAWTLEAKARFEVAKHCHALALIRVDGKPEFINELFEVGVDERERIEVARGIPLPCAVLDRSGGPLPFNASEFNIRRFDLQQDSWRGDFHDWLDSSARHPGPP